MPNLVHLIYRSVATVPFSNSTLSDLLSQARSANKSRGVTGMLLYANGSFFQVLEGEPEIVDELFLQISRDKRHRQVTVIIREPIARRSFARWTMGCTHIGREVADEILGMNDFFAKGESFAQIHEGRARKLLTAFKDGSWQERLGDQTVPIVPRDAVVVDRNAVRKDLSGADSLSLPIRRDYSFAYQPIINISTHEIFSYEALVRGINQESANDVLQRINPSQMYAFDEQSRILAIEMAASMGLSTHLNLNFLPLSVENSETAITSIIETVEKCDIAPDQVVLEILEHEIIRDMPRFAEAINQYRGSGMVVAIDDFGSGYAGLNLLAEFQPDLIKLDMLLVRDIESRGPRQAIVRGILRTCQDLGVDTIAEGVETEDEYEWLRNEGVNLFQGNLFARPRFEQLVTTFNMPK